MPAGPCRRPSRSAASTANRANSSSAYHRSGGVRVTRRGARVTVRERGAGPRSPQTLTVPCQPERRLADADRRPQPGAACRSAATGGTARQNDRRRAAAAGPGSAPAPGRRGPRRPAPRRPNGSRPDHRPGWSAGAAPPARSPRRAAATGPRPRRRRTPGPRAGGPDDQRRPPGQVGVAGPERAAGPGAEQLGEPHAGCRPHRPPVDRHPHQRRGHGAPGHAPHVQRDELGPGLRMSVSVGGTGADRSRHLGRRPAGDPHQLLVRRGEDRLRHAAGGPDLVVAGERGVDQGAQRRRGARPGRRRRSPARCAAGRTRGWPGAALRAEQRGDLGGVHPVGAGGEHQQRLAVRVEDQRVGDRADLDAERLGGRAAVCTSAASSTTSPVAPAAASASVTLRTPACCDLVTGSR